jgi:hypothetical protein
MNSESISNIHIKGTSDTPEVFLSTSGEFIISGISIPENTLNFYAHIFEWIDFYIANPAPSTILSFHIEYLNTSSTRIIVDFILKLNKIKDKDKEYPLLINWHYDSEDDDLKELGEDLENASNGKFTFIATS